jgi:hypothetical protein
MVNETCLAAAVGRTVSSADWSTSATPPIPSAPALGGLPRRADREWCRLWKRDDRCRGAGTEAVQDGDKVGWQWLAVLGVHHDIARSRAVCGSLPVHALQHHPGRCTQAGEQPSVIAGADHAAFQWL